MECSMRLPWIDLSLELPSGPVMAPEQWMGPGDSTKSVVTVGASDILGHDVDASVISMDVYKLSYSVQLQIK